MSNQSRSISNLNVSINGVSQIGRVKSVVIPKVAPEIETKRTIDSNFPSVFVVGMKQLDLSFVLYDYNPALLAAAGADISKESEVIITGFIREKDGTTRSVRFVAEGLITDIDTGTLEAGTIAEYEFTLEGLSKYKELYDGVTVYDINDETGTFIIDNDDIGSTIRQVLASA